MMRRMILAVVVALSGAACGDDSMGDAMSGTGGGTGSAAAGGKACNDVADALEAVCVRCGAMPGECRAAFMSSRSCGSATGIRDATSLYDACLPRLRALSCEQLTSDPATALGPTCMGQILFAP